MATRLAHSTRSLALAIAVLLTITSSFGVHTTTNVRIIGGHSAAPHGAPFIVSLQRWRNDRPGELPARHHCAASIVQAGWAVTAAHCLPRRRHHQGRRLLLVAGAHNIRLANEPYTQRRHIPPAVCCSSRAEFATWWWIHPWYDGGVAPFDIGLIRVEPAFDLNAPFVRAIALPTINVQQSSSSFAQTESATTARLFGWGALSASSSSSSSSSAMPERLQTAVVPLLPFGQCWLVYGVLLGPLHETNLCTGPLRGGVSACGGDSGGPLVQADRLIGVVSWGASPCGWPIRPSVYVRVEAFVGWLSSVMRRRHEWKGFT